MIITSHTPLIIQHYLPLPLPAQSYFTMSRSLPVRTHSLLRTLYTYSHILYPYLHSGILSGNDCYVGVGGLHTICRYEANTAERKGAVINRGVRVSKIVPIDSEDNETNETNESNDNNIKRIRKAIDTKNETKKETKETKETKGKAKGKGMGLRWELFGTGGSAALHDTAESIAGNAVHYSLGKFDAVIVTGTL